MTEHGILWLGGKPGMGKSAFMAKLVRDHVQHKTKQDRQDADSIIIPYFFQLSDGEICRILALTVSAHLHSL